MHPNAHFKAVKAGNFESREDVSNNRYVAVELPAYHCLSKSEVVWILRAPPS